MGYEPIETASVDELRALQLQRLTATLTNAYNNIDHYRQAFDAAGVHPHDVHGLDDLAKLPFLIKDHLRDAYPFGMFAVPREQLVRVHASSGTTGKPTVVGYTRHDLDVWSTVVARSIYAAGGRPGDLLHNSYGYGLFTGGLGAHYGAEKLGCTVVPMGGGQTEKQIQEALARLVQGRTTIAIAHRLSTLRNADRLVVLEGGRIVEVGTHAELIEKQGTFYDLVETQRQVAEIIAVKE